MNIEKYTKNYISRLPDSPGVYMYFNNEKKIIYIGKAKNLRNRVRSYCSKSIDIKTKKLVEKIRFISHLEVGSEFEAIFLEAELIKKHKPFYNLQLKDDKSPIHIIITKDVYPRILTARKYESEYKYKFGPFSNSKTVEYVLSMVRRIFPYSTHKIQKRKCFYSQIGLCNPCPSEIEKNVGVENIKLKKLYKNNISNIKKILEGDLSSLKREMLREIEKHSMKEEFEEALSIRKKYYALRYISEKNIPARYFIENPLFAADIKRKEVESLKRIVQKREPNILSLRRIECFDISHISGTGQSASMVVFINGSPDKSKYRHFRLRHGRGNNDFESMKEVAKRRFNYISKWGKPDLILVDGGKPQVRAFEDMYSDADIPVVGISKRFERLVFSVSGGYETVSLDKTQAFYLVQRIRDEAHRFAQKYHNELLKKSLLVK